MALSIETAGWLANWANIALIAGLVFSAVSGLLFLWASLTKDSYLKRARLSEAKEISWLQTEVETAKASAAHAEERLANVLAPRQIAAEDRARIIDAATPFGNQKFSGLVASDVQDAPALWDQLSSTLVEAGWKLEPPAGLRGRNPSAGIPMTPHDGVTIFVPVSGVPSGPPMSLATALNDAGIKTLLVGALGPPMRSGVIVIEVGTKSLSDR